MEIQIGIVHNIKICSLDDPIFRAPLYIFFFHNSLRKRDKTLRLSFILCTNLCVSLEIPVLSLYFIPSQLWNCFLFAFLIFILKLFSDHTHNFLTLTEILLSLEGTCVPFSSLKFWQFLFFPSTIPIQLGLEVRQVISFTPFPCLILSNLLKLFLSSIPMSSCF